MDHLVKQALTSARSSAELDCALERVFADLIEDQVGEFMPCTDDLAVHGFFVRTENDLCADDQDERDQK